LLQNTFSGALTSKVMVGDAKVVSSLSDNFSAATESLKPFKFIYIAMMISNDQKAEYRHA
jgi:hypothetical protein